MRAPVERSAGAPALQLKLACYKPIAVFLLGLLATMYYYAGAFIACLCFGFFVWPAFVFGYAERGHCVSIAQPAAALHCLNVSRSGVVSFCLHNRDCTRLGTMSEFSKLSIRALLEFMMAAPPLDDTASLPPFKLRAAPLKCALVHPERRLAVVALVPSEVGALEVALSEYEGVVDAVHLFESPTAHNPFEHASKPLIWPRLAARPRFSRFRVHYHICRRVAKDGSDMWSAENEHNACMNAAMQEVRHLCDIIVVGSIDEILARSTLSKLKRCRSIPSLPASSAIGMPLGRLGRSFQTGWHVPSMPYSFSLPTVCANTTVGRPFARVFRAMHPDPILGGLHMTNECRLASHVFKEQTATEHGQWNL